MFLDKYPHVGTLDPFGGYICNICDMPVYLYVHLTSVYVFVYGSHIQTHFIPRTLDHLA